MIDQVRPASLHDWLQAHPGVQPVVLDVREPWELQTASIKPAADFRLVSIPMGEIPARLAELDPHEGGHVVRVDDAVAVVLAATRLRVRRGW